MKVDLLECPPDKLTEHPRVVAAYNGLGCDPSYVMSYGIGMMLAGMAFAMRDASKPLLWQKRLLDLFRYPDGSVTDGLVLKRSQPEHWIIAATLAWEEGKK